MQRMVDGRNGNNAMSDVSVTIITKNEATHARACLESVLWAAEIILVDQFSEDGTAETAQSLGAKVFQEPWQGYARQKNSAIDKAQGPWILSLDADERVPPALRQEIEEILNGNNVCCGFYIPRKNYFCGRWISHGGWYPDYNLRLFRKGTGYFQERLIHEKVVVEGRVGYLKHPLQHYTYDSVDDYLQRLSRYSTLAAEEMEKCGKRPRWHQLLLHPLFTFVKMYCARRGFLDGWAGFFLAVSSSYYTFLKYAKLREKLAGWQSDIGNSD